MGIGVFVHADLTIVDGLKGNRISEVRLDLLLFLLYKKKGGDKKNTSEKKTFKKEIRITICISTVQQNQTWSPVYGGAPVTREVPVPSNKEEIIRHLLICIRKAVYQGVINVPGPQREGFVLGGTKEVGGLYVVHG